MGHCNAKVLDGGFAKWVKEGKPVESTDADTKEECFAYKLDTEKIKMFEEVKAFEDNEEERNYQLIDVRAPD